MKLQYYLNNVISPNLNEYDKDKPHLPKNRSLKGLGLGLNKKGIIHFGIIAIAVAIIIVGFLVFNPFKAKAKSEPEVRTIIEKEIIVKEVPSQPNAQTNPVQTTNNAGTTNLPPEELSPSCREPSGVFTQLWVRKKNGLTSSVVGTERDNAHVIGIFRYQGDCPTTIYVEAGIQNQRSALLSIMPFITGTKLGMPSVCDGNVHYNGAIFDNVQPSQELKFELKPEHYGVEGTYPIGIGVHTGCHKDGGIQIQSLGTNIAFSDTYSAFVIDTSYENLVK